MDLALECISTSEETLLGHIITLLIYCKYSAGRMEQKNLWNKTSHEDRNIFFLYSKQPLTKSKIKKTYCDEVATSVGKFLLRQ